MRLVLVQRLIQRIPRPGMGNVYDDATLFEFLILETSKPGSAGLRSLTKGEFQESV
jgi:hypothetical protein